MDDSFLNGLVGASIVVLFFLILMVLAFYIVYIIGLWKLFKKAGYDGWKSIIPFYNTYVLIEIAGLNWWYFLIACAGTIFSILGLDNSFVSFISSIATLFVNFIIFWNIAKKTHKNTVSTAILGTLFNPIMTMVVGFSKNYVFDNTVMVSPNGPFEGNQNTNNNANNSYDSNTNNFNTNVITERYCVGCGVKLKADSKFCNNCGKKVE